jgi:carboxymethylenebutenolidase
MAPRSPAHPARPCSLEKAGLAHEIVTYPGVDHAFFNDTGARYHAGTAATVYGKLIDWFGRYLA